LALTLLLVLSAPFLFTKLSMPFLDPDEGLYATISLEMARDGDWVMPHANGLPYLEKPPLYFWLTALTFVSPRTACGTNIRPSMCKAMFVELSAYAEVVSD